MKKILISFPYFRIGGVENLILTTAKELSKNNIDFKILTLYVEDSIKSEIKDFDIKFIKNLKK